MVSVRPIEEMQGFLKGMDSEIARDEEERA
jgi:hypothetical protein